ncbi:hypothetical protein Back11_32980 [Paenibacillus baekrokdamisoli]|uniref:Uncharacterized protein n=1 Tax=Paenibacillus baekrokdamisoli TaxID=1712516 RepID=A0A3G9JAM9_9BACL|nr:GIY-YIG nuclease family protein [Paenibacillus baekrokdamisoli]MBB3071534.1 hypothetical protein [Paenibacillus baekrokdamisoli]BBH21953.1 hypothetical protein Back11_32980 [Paenibacillus baekrokdamisoli]
MNRRKELQNEYGMKQRSMGVFQIVNEKNGKRYIAASPTLDSAWQREKFILDMGSHMNSSLQKEYKEQAGAQFEFQVLEKLKLGDEVRNDYKDIVQEGSTVLNRFAVQSYRDQLRKLEKKWLEELKPYEPDGYNRPPKQD